MGDVTGLEPGRIACRVKVKKDLKDVGVLKLSFIIIMKQQLSANNIAILIQCHFQFKRELFFYKKTDVPPFKELKKI